MLRWKKSFWPIAIGIGLVAGLVVSGFWPYTPLHAMSTDRSDTYAIATGPVDTEVEAVYLLDFLTGDLEAMVLGKQPRTWTGFFKTNVAADMGLDPQKNPKFLIVTGMAGLRRAGRHAPTAQQCGLLRGRDHQRQNRGLRHTLVPPHVCRRPDADRAAGGGGAADHASAKPPPARADGPGRQRPGRGKRKRKSRPPW